MSSEVSSRDGAATVGQSGEALAVPWLDATHDRSLDATHDRSLDATLIDEQLHEPAALDQTVPQGSLPVHPGEIVEGRYRVEQLLGLGGMGCVYRAHHLHLNQPVALKFMLPEVAQSRDAVARFMREARAAVRLRTEHIGHVLDLGILPSGTPFLVMEFLVGETAEQRLRRLGVFTPQHAVAIVRQAISGLTEAHGQGIVHCDLKPANLFLARRPNGESVKVLDFGIARSFHPDIEDGLAFESNELLVGSPQSMAPEQLVSSSHVDARVDVWGLGCTLYELIAGCSPFDLLRPSVAELAHAIAHEPHRPLLQVRPDVPAAMSGVIDRCLKKLPRERYALSELDQALAELEHLLAGTNEWHAADRAPPIALTDMVETRAGRTDLRSSSDALDGIAPAPRGKARPALRTFGVAAGALALVAAAALAWSGRPQSPERILVRAPPVVEHKTIVEAVEPAAPGPGPTAPKKASAKPRPSFDPAQLSRRR